MLLRTEMINASTSKGGCYYCAWGFPSLLGFRSLNVSESGPASVSPVSRIHGALKVDSGDVQIVEVKSRCYKRVCVCMNVQHCIDNISR